MSAVSGLLFLALAAVLTLLARWGSRNAHVVPSALPEQERDRRARVLQRGAWTCRLVAAAFAAAAVGTFVTQAL